MAKMVSIQEMTAKVCALESSDVNEWERGFLASIRRKTEAGGELTEKQEDVIEGIYKKHFTTSQRERTVDDSPKFR